MPLEKCLTCKWYIVMSYCDGETTKLAEKMCHYNWKKIEKVRPDECHYSKKKEVKEE